MWRVGTFENRLEDFIPALQTFFFTAFFFGKRSSAPSKVLPGTLIRHIVL